MVTLSDREKTLIGYVSLLCKQQFSGTLVVHFEKGYPQKATRQESLLPADMRDAMRRRPVFVVSKKAGDEAPVQEIQSEEAKGDPDGSDDNRAV